MGPFKDPRIKSIIDFEKKFEEADNFSQKSLNTDSTMSTPNS